MQHHIIQAIGLRNTYLTGLITFGFSMTFTVAFPNVVVLNVCAAISGLGFAVITTIPNTLVTMYHNHPEVFFKVSQN